MKSEQKHGTSVREILLYVLALAATAVAVYGFSLLVHRYTVSYEAASPEHVMERYMEQQLPTELSAAIDEYAMEHETDYQSAGEIAAALREKLPMERWGYQRSVDYTDENPMFTLYCDHHPLGTVALESGSSNLSNFNMDSWQTPAAEFRLDLLARTVTIVAPFGCSVYVNGAELNDDLVQETAGIYPQLLDYELILPQANQLMLYVVEHVVSDIAVEAEIGCMVLTDEEHAVYYVLPACEAALADSLLVLAENFTRAHVDFTLNKVSLWGVQQYTVTNGALYNRLTQDAVGLDWGNGIGATITKLEVKDFLYYGNAATCRVSYKMTTNEGLRTESIFLLLVNASEGWRVAVIEE